MTLGINSLSTLSDQHTREIQWAWSANGKTLYYVQDDPTDAEQFNIVAYTNGNTRILKAVSNKEIILSFYPAPDNKTLAIMAVSWLDSTLYWLTTTGGVIQQYNYSLDIYTDNLRNQPLTWLLSNPAQLAIIAGQEPQVFVYESDGKLILQKPINNLDLHEFEWIEWMPCSEEF